MMNLDVLLPELDDIELSKLVMYQYAKLLTNSKLKVHNELKRRNLNWRDVKNLFQKEIHSLQQPMCKCPKCGSEKFYTENNYHSYVNKHQTYDVITEIQKCALCDEVYDATPPDGILNSLKKKIQTYQANTYNHFYLEKSNMVNNNN